MSVRMDGDECWNFESIGLYFYLFHEQSTDQSKCDSMIRVAFEPKTNSKTSNF